MAEWPLAAEIGLSAILLVVSLSQMHLARRCRDLEAALSAANGALERVMGTQEREKDDG